MAQTHLAPRAIDTYVGPGRDVFQSIRVNGPLNHSVYEVHHRKELSPLKAEEVFTIKDRIFLVSERADGGSPAPRFLQEVQIKTSRLYDAFGSSVPELVFATYLLATSIAPSAQYVWAASLSAVAILGVDAVYGLLESRGALRAKTWNLLGLTPTNFLYVEDVIREDGKTADVLVRMKDERGQNVIQKFSELLEVRSCDSLLIRSGSK